MKSCFKASNPTAQSTVMESAAPQFAGGPKLLEQIRDPPMVGSGESDGLKSSAQAEAANPTRPAKKTNPGFSITNEFMVAPSLPGCRHPAMQKKSYDIIFCARRTTGESTSFGGKAYPIIRNPECTERDSFTRLRVETTGSLAPMAVQPGSPVSHLMVPGPMRDLVRTRHGPRPSPIRRGIRQS